MRARTKAWITLASPFVGVLLAEAMVRAMGWQALPQPRWQGDTNQPSSDPVLRFENRPGATLRLEYLHATGASPVEAIANVNAQGLRGPVVSQEKPEGVFRIACIGDSHTFGYGVNDDEPWPMAMQRALDDAVGVGRVEVLNAGVCAYDTEQEVALLERRLLRYEPDLAILGFYLNDAAVRDEPQSAAAESDWLLSLCHPYRKGLVRTLRKHSRFADLLATSLYARRHLADFARTRSSLYGDDAPGWTRCRAALESAQRVAREADVRFLVVLYPFLIEQDGELGSHDAFAIVSSFCRDRTIPCWDFESDFLGRDLSALRVHPLDFHSNATAHRIFGEAVARRLASSGWIESATPAGTFEAR